MSQPPLTQPRSRRASNSTPSRDTSLDVSVPNLGSYPLGEGFNVYTGTVNSAEFDRIVTHADGAVGIQISQPVGEISVRRGIETYGGTGDSLVKGVVVKLAATALSIKPGGSARQIDVTGGLLAHGEGVDPIELHGPVRSLHIGESFTAVGRGIPAN
jgi:hypothetical protein